MASGVAQSASPWSRVTPYESWMSPVVSMKATEESETYSVAIVVTVDSSTSPVASSMAPLASKTSLVELRVSPTSPVASIMWSETSLV